MEEIVNSKIFEVNESQYNQCWGNPTLFHWAKSIEKDKF